MPTSPQLHPLQPRVVRDVRDAAALGDRLAVDLFQVAGEIDRRGDTLSYLYSVIPRFARDKPRLDERDGEQQRDADGAADLLRRSLS